MKNAALFINTSTIQERNPDRPLGKAVITMNTGKKYEVDFGEIRFTHKIENQKVEFLNCDRLSSNWEVLKFLKGWEEIMPWQ